MTKTNSIPKLLGVLAVLVGASTASAQDMPAVPGALEQAGKIRVGTKCDYPPEGYLDNSGTPVGVEVAMAHQIAKYAFGDDAEAEIVCVTSANRVPALIGDKIDLIIATMGITPDRAEVVDFTQPYAWASQGVIVRAGDAYNAVADLEGHSVAFVKGALAIPYFEENYPTIEPLQLDGVSDALQALMTNRVDGYAHDTPVLMTLTAGNDKIRLLDDQFKITLRAAAVRPGETELLDFVNASLTKMAAEGKFKEWFEAYYDGDDIAVKLNFWDMAKKPAE
ncbi:MAG: transporter substrate-binding domain-containing protein [Jhaorihella sp.]